MPDNNDNRVPTKTNCAKDGKDITITEELGGVQGSSPNEETGLLTSEPEIPSGEATEMPAPDAGEIEWAGGLIKKPPASKT